MRRSRGSEEGYALLLVFLMAALIAISLYAELPRVAFQSQRHKEQLLMARGEQYKRGLQMYYQANNRQYPRTIEELEGSSGRHYARHHYIDPMTGKAEWRIIHVQGNVVTDSVMSKQSEQTSKVDSSYMSVYSSIGDSSGAGGAKPQDRRRASDTPEGQLAFPGAPGNTEAGSGAQPLPPMPPMPGMTTGSSNPTLVQAGNASNPAQAGPQVLMPPGVVTPGAFQQTQQSNTSPSGYMNVPSAAGGQPGQVATPFGTSAQTGMSQPGMNQQGMPGSSPFMPSAPGQPGMQGMGGSGPGGAMNMPASAASMINDILTRPNPQGALIVQQSIQAELRTMAGGLVYLSAANQPGIGGAGGGSMLGGGVGGSMQGVGMVAGVASKSEQQAIMVYNDRTAYNEWEYIFDIAKLPPLVPLSGNSLSGSTQPGNTIGRGGMPGQSGFDSTGRSALGGTGPGGGGFGMGQTAMPNASGIGQAGAGGGGQLGGMPGMSGVGQPGGMAGISGLGQPGGIGMGNPSQTGGFGSIGGAGTPNTGQFGPGGMQGVSMGSSTTPGAGQGGMGAQGMMPGSALPTIRLGRP